ncbi:hypothetical protein CR513_45671, partial [Mucuna pruriens]
MSFLGLASYYRRFIEGFSKLTLLLTRLTCKDQVFVWDLCENTLVLILPNLSEPFCGVLRCIQDGLKRNGGKVVVYASQKLKTCEKNYPTHDLELTLRRWLEYLKDFEFSRSYHLDKANVVADVLSKKSLHVSTLMVMELDLIEQFKDLSIVCEITPKSVKSSMLKITSSLMDEIQEECVPSFPKLRKLILEEGQISSSSVHSSATKMY